MIYGLLVLYASCILLVSASAIMQLNIIVSTCVEDGDMGEIPRIKSYTIRYESYIKSRLIEKIINFCTLFPRRYRKRK